MTLYEIKIQQILNESKNEINNRNIFIYKNQNHIEDNNKKNNNNYLFEHINSIFIKSNNINNKNDVNNIKENLSFKMKKSIYNTNKKDNYQNSQIKKNENNNLKLETERLKNEISILIKDINEQQKEISLLKKSNNANELKSSNNKIYDYENLNKNIFTKSEYMKYLLIYDFTNINEIINVFYFMINNTKQNIDKMNIIDNKDELINLKNEHILNESLIEIVKNYLIVVEKIKKYCKENNYEDNLIKIKNIFIEGLFYKINEFPEKAKFLRKLINIIFELFT